MNRNSNKNNNNKNKMYGACLTISMIDLHATPSFPVKSFVMFHPTKTCTMASSLPIGNEEMISKDKCQ